LTAVDPSNMPQSEAFFENVVSDDDSLNLLICVDDPDSDVDAERDDVMSNDGEGAESNDVADAEGDGDPVPVGDIALFKLHERTRWGEIAITISPEYWGNGYATAASKLLVAHAFDERNLHRLQARVIETNDASRRIWEKLGFELEGRLRENQFDGGEYVDTLYFGLLESEWRDRDGED
jgi:RimJ/RimL family protein N-acetyltransferase